MKSVENILNRKQIRYNRRSFKMFSYSIIYGHKKIVSADRIKNI